MAMHTPQKNWRIRAGQQLQAVIIAAALCCGAGSAALAVDLQSKSALLLNDTDKTLVFSRQIDRRIPPANLTKLLVAATVMDAVRKGEIALETTLKVSEHAWRTGGAPAQVTTMFARVGSLVSVEDLLRGLIIHSANDAAIVLAEGIDGSQLQFAQRMNKLAQAIGMGSSNFVNPTGYPDKNQYTTLRDLARLASHMGRNEAGLTRLYSAEDFTWNKIRQRNKNELIRDIKGLNGYGQAYSEDEGFLGLGRMQVGNKQLIAIVSGASSKQDRLSDMELLLNPASKGWRIRPLFAEGQYVGGARVYGGKKDYVSLVTPDAVATLLNPSVKEGYSLEYSYDGPLKAPVKPGVIVGELRVMQKKDVIYRAPLVTGEAVARGSLSERAGDAVGELLYKSTQGLVNLIRR